MKHEALKDYDSLLFGRNSDPGLVAVEPVESKAEVDEMVLFFRRGAKMAAERERFEPFIIAASAALGGCPVEHRAERFDGAGPLNVGAVFPSWKHCLRAKAWLAKKTGASPSAPGAPYLCLNDPVHQHLMATGRTLFLGMDFEDVRRMQVDIECFTAEGYEFCNAERKEDRIIAIALADQTGWVEVLSGAELSEKALLERFIEVVRERDPDVVEGHNIFNFDLPYIAERARRHGVPLKLGRDGGVPRRRPSRFSVGERTIAYDRFDIFGRHVVDTLFLVHAYDVAHRSLEGFGLKEVARHFGVAAENRTYIEGSRIAREFGRDPRKVMRYVRDDAVETGAVSALLSRSQFVQAQMLPYSYQNVCVRGTATRIDALMLREYIRRRRALPMPDAPRAFAGGYADMFVQGRVENVHHCDVRSLYPSLMLTRKLAPRTDELGVFLKLLEVLRDFRVRARRQMDRVRSESERLHWDALQGAFKILINSFYGYLGFSQARFSDFAAAERVTEMGRNLLRDMIQWLRKHGASPVEIDTDGIYFVPPAGPREKPLTGKAQELFRKSFADWLPEGIEIEFDGEYRSMYSYKMKNYALLTETGEIVLKGAALRSRGLEPFQRAFLGDLIRLELEGRSEEAPDLKARYEQAIRGAEWPIERFAKTERLQDSPATYAAKRAGGKTPKNALYELALHSGRPYRAGDQLSFYVTGTKKSVPVHENARLVSEWNPKHRDENLAYYMAKLEALYGKFGPGQEQGELGQDEEPGGEAGEEE